MGFAIIVALQCYVILSLGVIALTVRHAKKRGKSGIKWGLGAAFIMYNLVFWDWLPTVAVHKYLCATKSGFWVYKTLNQWKTENPGVLETLGVHRVPPHQFEGSEDHLKSTTVWNSRIKSIHIFDGPIFLHCWRREDVIVDTKTNEVLARYIDYSTSQKRRQAGWTGWKFWLASDNCRDCRDKAISFVKFLNDFKGVEK